LDLRLSILAAGACRRSPSTRSGDSVKPGTFVRVEPFKDGKYHSVGGVATAYRGVSIFLEGNRSAAMGAKLGAAEAHIDRAIPEGREQLENYRLYKDHNPADAYWAKQYKMPNFTSLATSGNGQMQFWLNQVGKQDDFDHELGHAMTTAGSPAAPVAWRRAMEMDRRNVAEFLTKAQIQPAKSRIPMISGANKDGLTTYAEKAFESGSLAEDWAESSELVQPLARERLGREGWFGREGRT